jgi:hypothetical protein
MLDPSNADQLITSRPLSNKKSESPPENLTSPKNTLYLFPTKKSLSLAAKRGKDHALRGYKLPAEDKLLTKYGPENMAAYIDAFHFFSGTEEENKIRYAAYMGRHLSSHEAAKIPKKLKTTAELEAFEKSYKEYNQKKEKKKKEKDPQAQNKPDKNPQEEKHDIEPSNENVFTRAKGVHLSFDLKKRQWNFQTVERTSEKNEQNNHSNSKLTIVF